MRQFQQAKRRLEAYEHRHGDHDSIGSNASSNGSIDTASTQQQPAPNSRASSQEPIPPSPQVSSGTLIFWNLFATKLSVCYSKTNKVSLVLLNGWCGAEDNYPMFYCTINL